MSNMKNNARKIGYIQIISLFFLSTVMAGTSHALWPRVAPSKDGTPISYEIAGKGEPTLVFVHGWSCDSRYFREQVPFFSERHRVVTMDLAGHGHSGMNRTTYSMKAFGEDVAAVAKASGDGSLILIGHSMGGPVIAEAARILSDRVVGLIGIDTFGNIEYPMTPEQCKTMTAPLEKDFQSGCRQFVSPMFVPETDSRLREWVLSDMASAPPNVALSAMNQMMAQYISGEAARIFKAIHCPVVSVSADLWPINYEANRKHMLSFDAIVLKGSDHFLMMARPKEFNASLNKAVLMVIEKRTPLTSHISNHFDEHDLR